jgi:DNA primase
MRYDNVGSAVAEEGILSLVMADATFFDQLTQLQPEEFSSPFLGRAFQLLRDQWEMGRDPSPNDLAGQLQPEELSRLVEIQSRPVTLSNGNQALSDYIKKMRKEKMKQGISSTCDDDVLMAFRDKKFTEEHA